MKKYKYKARDPHGKMIRGEVEAATQQQAAKLVRERGYVVISLKVSSIDLNTILSRFRSRISSSDITAFTRQLATMVNAGLPIVQGLSILRMQLKSAMGNVVTLLLADVENGESFSTALKKHPKAFSPTYIALIKAGETGGVLDKVLTRLADNLERQQEFRGKVKGALIYPVIIVVGMVIVAAIMIIFVIPRLTSLYTQFDAELPLTTRALIGLSDLVINFWFVFAIAISLATWGFVVFRRTKRGKRKIAQFVFKTPLFGELQKEIILAEFTRTLSLMIGAGVPILEGLAVTSEVMGNIIISEAIVDATSQVEKGFPIAFSFAKHSDVFPYLLSQMMAVGEETGKMDEVLLKVSRVFEVNSEQKVKALTSAIEPAVMIVLGIGVAFLVISIILPIYNLTTAL